MKNASRHKNRRGTILIVALGILFIIATLVATMGRSMSVEATASANYAAGVQAAAIERGAEQYVIGMIIQLQQEGSTFYDLPDSDFAAVKIGDGYFWIVRPNYPNDPEFSQFGLVDENAKININTLNNWPQADQGLMTLGMTQDSADALLSWGNEGGSDYSVSYASLPTPYQTKGAAFESIEELLLVNGFTRELLYGQSAGPVQTQGGIGLGQQMATVNPALGGQPDLVDGIADDLSVYGALSSAGSPPTSAIRVNVVDAPREVLVALMEAYGLPDSDADAIIAGRNIDDMDDGNAQSAISGDWQTIESSVNGPAANMMGQYSADIVAVSANGRAFKRVQVVIDATEQNSTTPVIIYRRDLTNYGLPANFDPNILTTLRAGQPIPDAQDISQVGSSI